MEYVRCSLCGKDNFKYYAVRTKQGYPGTIKVQCKDCDLIYTNPRMTTNELKDFYKNYYDKLAMDEIGFKNSVLKAKELNRDAIIDIQFYRKNILNYKESGKYLEIGGGLGFQAWIAQELGFDVFVTEYDPSSVIFAKENFNLNKYSLGDLEDIKYPDNTFDFISAWHCIEHVQDMEIFLEEVFRILKPGGVFYFATPNLGSYLYRAHRFLKLCTFSIPIIVDGIEHTYGLSPKTAKLLCEKFGFEILDIHTFGQSKRKCAPPDLGTSTLMKDMKNLILGTSKRSTLIVKVLNHFLGSKLSAHVRKPEDQ
jgi:SAM-dependent methyltransferase